MAGDCRAKWEDRLTWLARSNLNYATTPKNALKILRRSRCCRGDDEEAVRDSDERLSATRLRRQMLVEKRETFTAYVRKRSEFAARLLSSHTPY